MARVLLGFGGNLGDPVRTIEAALERLRRSRVAVLARSGFYRTPPWGPVPQPDFVNAAALIETDRAPPALLALTRSIEDDLGRERDVRWGPRSIDIDILDYDGSRLDSPDLVLPHPRMVERAFVLVPLLDIAPDWTIAGRTIRDWAAALDRTGISRIEPTGGARPAGGSEPAG